MKYGEILAWIEFDTADRARHREGDEERQISLRVESRCQLEVVAAPARCGQESRSTRLTRKAASAVGALRFTWNARPCSNHALSSPYLVEPRTVNIGLPNHGLLLRKGLKAPRQPPIWSQMVDIGLQNHGLLPRKCLKAPQQAPIWSRYETLSDHRSAIEILRISCTPNQPQYGFSY